MQRKKVINRPSDRKKKDSVLSEHKKGYTYKYTFCCSECGCMVKEVTTHSFDTSMSYNGVCPNGCLGTITMKTSVVGTPPQKYTKEKPYNG